MKITKPQPHYIKTITKYFQNGLEVDFNNIDPDDYWHKSVLNSNDYEIYWQNNRGYWEKKEYNDMGKPTNYINSSGHWYKYEYDDYGHLIYYECGK